MKKENEPFIITVIQDVANITSLVNSQFKDEAKAQVWLNSDNILTEHKSPIEYIFEGRTEELKAIINEL